jgi:UDP-2,3-diacylglucosamine pyrophosphatase LpxH
MATRVFVVSDLHLGGTPDFQICTPSGQQRLADFVDWAGGQGPTADVHLVLAGDIVDFLAEAEDGVFEAFTASDAGAARKLGRVLDGTPVVWDALAHLVERGAALTLLLGNHDIELSLPATRRVLLSRLGPGRVEFVYDNQALALGPVLIEHGNRYDCWNAVAHDQLRQARSRASRREPQAGQFDAQPGSELVARVMNPIKRQYRFIDLLKPERAGVVPLLAFLHPVTFQRAWDYVSLQLEAARVRFAEDQSPLDPDKVAAAQDVAREDALLMLAHRLAAGGDPGKVSSGAGRPGFVERWRRAVEGWVRAKELDELLEALRANAGAHGAAFDPGVEDEEYLRPARARALAGFRVVVLGHTHLAKRVALEGGALYLNTGTWADLMRVPEAVLGGDRKALEAFADDIANDRLGARRRLIPTFADITLDGDAVRDAGIFFFDGAGATPPLDANELRRRLEA